VETCQKAGTVNFEDEQKFDVTEMEDDYLEELMAFAKNDTAMADVPETFVAYAKAE
jgi:hypothetical protein